MRAHQRISVTAAFDGSGAPSPPLPRSRSFGRLFVSLFSFCLTNTLRCSFLTLSAPRHHLRVFFLLGQMGEMTLKVEIEEIPSGAAAETAR